MSRELPTLDPPPNGIGWTPDRFRLEIWMPNCGITMRPSRPPGTYTWEQATEMAYRIMKDAGDPVLRITFITIDPMEDGTP